LHETREERVDEYTLSAYASGRIVTDTGITSAKPYLECAVGLAEYAGDLAYGFCFEHDIILAKSAKLFPFTPGSGNLVKVGELTAKIVTHVRYHSLPRLQ